MSKIGTTQIRIDGYVRDLDEYVCDSCGRSFLIEPLDDYSEWTECQMEGCESESNPIGWFAFETVLDSKPVKGWREALAIQ